MESVFSGPSGAVSVRVGVGEGWRSGIGEQRFPVLSGWPYSRHAVKAAELGRDGSVTGAQVRLQEECVPLATGCFHPGLAESTQLQSET